LKLTYKEFQCPICKNIFPQSSRTRRLEFCANCKKIRHAEQGKIHAVRIGILKKRETAERKKQNQMRREQGFSKWYPTWNGNAECVRKYSQNVAEQTGDCFATHAR